MRVKTDTRRRLILKAASEIFREQGFVRATMTAVSRRAGGSKATLYRYYKSKEDLFIATMLERVLDRAKEVFDTLQPSADPRLTLEQFGAGLLALFLSDEALCVRRKAIAEAARSGAGATLYPHGGEALWSRLANFLEAEMLAGGLRSEDPWTVAMQLRGMLEADLVNSALLGARVETRPSQLRQVAAQAVEVLFRAYDPQELHHRELRC